MIETDKLLASLQEDIDLLVYDSQPTPEELKIVNDLSVTIAFLKDLEEKQNADRK